MHRVATRHSQARLAQVLAALCLVAAGLGDARADLPATIEAVKRAVVVVGRYRPTASPRFALSGTGFAVGDGNTIVTNAHVVETPGQDITGADLVVQVRVSKTELQMRTASVIETDPEHDLVLLHVEGAKLPTLALRDSDTAREGQSIAFMGFPIGGVLGFSPVTHRGMISSITPIALPGSTASVLDAKTIARLRQGTFDIFQLDATAYPGNSGGPLFDPDSGEVLGVVNMVFVKATKESALTSALGQPSGISYAIPAKFIAQLLQRKTPR